MVLVIYQILDLLLTVARWIIILHFILSLLIVFNVINTSNDGVRRFLVALERFLDPLYRPIRKILPDFGGLDFSPLVLLLAISLINQIILPDLAYSLIASGTS